MSVTMCQPSVVDLLYLCSQARPDEITQYEALIGESWDAQSAAVGFFNRPGVKFVLVNDLTNKPIAAGGYDLVIPGVWHSWMVGTMEAWGTHWRSITKYSRRVMTGLLDDGARRLQTCVLATRFDACEWYKRGLLMQYEGRMSNYGMNGEAMDMYARINHG